MLGESPRRCSATRDPLGLCTPMPECLAGLGSLKEGLKETGEGIKSIPSQIADFASDPLKGGFVADLASIPLTVAGAGPAVVAGGAVGAKATSALGRLAVRAQVALANDKGLSIGAGLVAGYNNLPVPAGAPATFTWAHSAGRILDTGFKIAKAYNLIP